jgi:hypothetical protein
LPPLFWITDGILNGSRPPGLETPPDAGKDVTGQQLGISAFDRRQRIECHVCTTSFGEEASRVP